MAEAPRKPRAIMLVDFQEEVLSTSRKLLRCIFQDRYGEWRYQWTPPWRDKDKERGVIALTTKANEIEEWNDAQGAWDDELKKLSQEVQLLRELGLPVKVSCSELITTAEQNWAYRFEISLAGENGRLVYNEEEGSFSINSCTIRYARLKTEFLNAPVVKERQLGIDPRATYNSGEWIEDESVYPGGYYGSDSVVFGVWIPHTVKREHYRVIGREVAAFVRSYLRRVLADYDSIRKGFED